MKLQENLRGHLPDTFSPFKKKKWQLLKQFSRPKGFFFSIHVHVCVIKGKVCGSTAHSPGKNHNLFISALNIPSVNGKNHSLCPSDITGLKCF